MTEKGLKANNISNKIKKEKDTNIYITKRPTPGTSHQDLHHEACVLLDAHAPSFNGCLGQRDNSLLTPRRGQLSRQEQRKACWEPQERGALCPLEKTLDSSGNG